jgi:uncharacterized membrane protein
MPPRDQPRADDCRSDSTRIPMKDDSTPLSRAPERPVRTDAAPRGSATSRPALPHHPVVIRIDAERAENLQLRLADRITSFAGSMPFVYVHAIGIAVWMLFIESSPWSKLTLAVSLEAIFLSAFLMIGQNRQAAFQQAKADHDFQVQERELKTNTGLTREIHDLARGLYEHVLGTDPSGSAPTRGTRRGRHGRTRSRRTRQALHEASGARPRSVDAKPDRHPRAVNDSPVREPVRN